MIVSIESLFVTTFSVGLFFFIAMNILRWASTMLSFDLPRIGFISSVTDVIIFSLMMKAWVTSCRVRSMFVVSVS